MIKEGHFGFYETFSLIAIVLITKIFYTSPMAIIKSLGTAAWYGTLISGLAALVFFFFLLKLMQRFPQQDLYQIYETVTGKIIGKLLTLIFAAYILYYAGINLREFVTVLKVYTMPFTPPSILIFAFLLVVIAMAYVGLEGIARVSYVFFSPIIGSLFLILLLAIPSYDLSYLQPSLGYGLGKTVEIGLVRSAAYGEIVFLAIFIRSIHGIPQFKKAGLYSLVFSGITFSICLACILMAFQYTVGSEHLSGMYQLTRIIYFSKFFQRVEAIFLFIWVISSVITVSLAFYLSLSSYCRAFKITNHRPLILPFAVLCFMVAFFPNHIADIIEIHVRFLRNYSSVIMMFMPLMVWIIALLRGKKGGKNYGKAKA